jgi:hypothetical protein
MEKYGKIYRYLLHYVMNIFILSVPEQDRGEWVVPKPSSSFKILQQIGHCFCKYSDETHYFHVFEQPLLLCLKPPFDWFHLPIHS